MVDILIFYLFYNLTKKYGSIRLPINPAIVKLNTNLIDNFDKMLLANAITLTAGTSSLTVDNKLILNNNKER